MEEPPVTEEPPAQPLKKRKPREPPLEPSAALLAKMEERRSLTVRRATRASSLQANAFDPKSGPGAWAAELQKLGLGDYLPRKENGDSLASLLKRRLVEFANKRADDPTAELATPTGAPTGSFDLPASCTEASLRKQAAALDFRGRASGCCCRRRRTSCRWNSYTVFFTTTSRRAWPYRTSRSAS